jgi:hypothetical protein
VRRVTLVTGLRQLNKPVVYRKLLAEWNAMRVVSARRIRCCLLASALLAGSPFALAQLQPPPAKAPSAQSSDGEEQRLDLSIVDGVLPTQQRLIKVLKGQPLRWRITSNQAGELHLHAYRLHAAVQPGHTAELAFTVHATGKFRLEWHGAEDKATPKDAAPGHHRAAPLATLEVRPR